MPARRDALKGDLSAPETPTTPTPTNKRAKPPDTHTVPENRQSHTFAQVQKLQTLTRFLGLYALRGRDGRGGPVRVPLLDFILPLNYFPNGGLGVRLYCPRRAAASCCVFALWHGWQTAIRFSGELLPPLATFSMWSTSVASCVHPLYRNPHW